jgi:hypothetical protein
MVGQFKDYPKKDMILVENTTHNYCASKEQKSRPSLLKKNSIPALKVETTKLPFSVHKSATKGMSVLV